MFFIGDIHGKWRSYFKLIKKLPKSIQVGDCGFGFSNRKSPRAPWAMNHRFIRGNHDDPKEANAHPNCLGDYGVTKDGIFFVAGGYSIDVDWRKANQHLYPTPIWWKDEEIAESEFEKILKLYEINRPRIVVSHDCPSEVRDILPAVKGKLYRNRTSDGLLSAMFKAYQPKFWIFGHYHEAFDSIINGTRFVCLAELETFEVIL